MLAESAAQAQAMPPAGQAAARRPRRRIPLGFLLAGIAVAGAVLYLVLANTGASAEYYLTIGELRTCRDCQVRAVRVAGNVAANSIVRAAGQPMHFTIVDGAESLPGVYSGTVPDIFRAGIQVVVEGHLVGGTFQAQNLFAKCPSKFQSATPGSSGSSG